MNLFTILAVKQLRQVPPRSSAVPPMEKTKRRGCCAFRTIFRCRIACVISLWVSSVIYNPPRHVRTPAQTNTAALSRSQNRTWALAVCRMLLGVRPGWPSKGRRLPLSKRTFEAIPGTLLRFIMYLLLLHFEFVIIIIVNYIPIIIITTFIRNIAIQTVLQVEQRPNECESYWELSREKGLRIEGGQRLRAT